MNKEKMLSNKLKEIAKKNKEGFTVFVKYDKTKNKCYIDNLNKSIYNKDIYRYCIGITNNNTKKKINKFFNDIDKYFYHGYIGGWYNKENNQYYIDKVIVTSNKEYAIQLAKKHNQISIYDLKLKKDIKIHH